MRLTPKQAETLAALIGERPGVAVTVSKSEPNQPRGVRVVFDNFDAFVIGGRGKATAV